MLVRIRLKELADNWSTVETTEVGRLTLAKQTEVDHLVFVRPE
jgi:hypothetical protein